MKVPELRRRILFTLAMIVVVRLGVQIPLPGIDVMELQKVIDVYKRQLLCHIHGCQQYLFQLSILPFQGNIRSDFISLFIQAAIFKLINIIFTFQFFPNIIRGCLLYTSISACSFFGPLIVSTV